MMKKYQKAKELPAVQKGAELQQDDLKMKLEGIPQSPEEFPVKYFEK